MAPLERTELLNPLGYTRLRIISCLGGDMASLPQYLRLEAGEDVFGAFRRLVSSMVQACADDRDRLTRSLIGAARLLVGELAGAVEVLGVHHFFQAGFSPGYGYEGIAVAILGGNSPAGIVLAALFWGALANGAVELELSTGLSRHVVSLIQALVVLAVAVRRWPLPLRRVVKV